MTLIHATRAALLRSAIVLIEGERQCLVEAECLLNPDLTPRLDTFPPEKTPALAKLDRAITGLREWLAELEGGA